MNNLTKLVACLYAGMVVANATEITFNGTNQEGPINFEVEDDKDNNNIILKKVSINENSVQKLKAKGGNKQIQITLKIPAMVNGQHVVIGEPKYIVVNNLLKPKPMGAFSDLRSNDVQLIINFIEEDDDNHVQLPENCSGLFSRSNSITEISGIYLQAQVTNTQDMFSGCKRLTNLDLSNFDTQNVTDMSNMFCGCSSLKSLNLGNFNTHNVSNMSWMFIGCDRVTNLDLSNFNTQNVVNMQGMFCACRSLTNLNLSNFNTQNVKNMAHMFRVCRSFKNLNLSNFNTQNVVNMQGMFCGCENVTSLNLSNFNTRNVVNMHGMFSGCKSVTNLDLSNFDTKNVTDMGWMFEECESLTYVNVTVPQNANKEHMFYNCHSLLNKMLG